MTSAAGMAISSDWATTARISPGENRLTRSVMTAFALSSWNAAKRRSAMTISGCLLRTASSPILRFRWGLEPSVPSR